MPKPPFAWCVAAGWILLGITGVPVLAAAETAPAVPDWGLGPFGRPEGAQPIISPDPAAVFDCPVRQAPVHWEALHTFNPAAVVRDGKVCVLYRAEDDTGQMKVGGHTSRLGLATSDDGLHFSCRPTPVFFPAGDGQQTREWEGGCEDPRCVETEDGTFVLTYTQYARGSGPATVDLGVATSRDLEHWTKLGPALLEDGHGRVVTARKSASILCAVRPADGHLVAARVNGKYWMYYGEGAIRVAASEDFLHWTITGAPLLGPRAGHFDSDLAECGPPAVLTPRGIVLLYNGKNAAAPAGDPHLRAGVYTDGQALFDAGDPTRLLARTDEPFFAPALPWEATGQYAAGTTFIEGLVRFHGRWLLYYGCADSRVGVALGPASSEAQAATEASTAVPPPAER